jgi:hypothetical protein
MLHLLNVKQALSDGLLDGAGDIAALKMPSGKGAMVERMRAMLDSADSLGPRIVSAEDAAAEDLRRRHGDRVSLIEVTTAPSGAPRMLVVLDVAADELAQETARLSHSQDPASLSIEVVDRATWLVLRRLAKSGMVSLTEAPRRVLHVSPDLADHRAAPDAAAARTSGWRAEAERSVKMATVLAAGGFPEEAPPLLAKALRHALAARLNASGEGEIDPALADLNQVRRLVKRGARSSEASHVLTALHPDAAKPTAVEAADLVQSTTRLIDALTANA